MGLNIILQDERGKTIDQISDPKNILHRLLPSVEDTTFQCLRFIDWYGDTIFNRLQMELFLNELERITQKASTKKETNLLANIRNLAQRCQNEPHLYLKFCGD